MNAAGITVCSGIHIDRLARELCPFCVTLRLRITSLTSNYDYDKIFYGGTIKGGIWIRSIKVYIVKMD